MTTKEYHIVALNGSLRGTLGFTSNAIQIFKEIASASHISLEEILLHQHDIKPCRGCGQCIETGICEITDDHKAICKKTIEADAVIFASPVYVLNYSSHFQKFFERSLPYNFRPFPFWKPGFEIVISQGLNDDLVQKALCDHLRIFGTFSIGCLKVMTDVKKGLLDEESIRFQARHLTLQLYSCLKEKKRYPPTGSDFKMWTFYKENISAKEALWGHKFEPWEKLKLMEDFKNYLNFSIK